MPRESNGDNNELTRSRVIEYDLGEIRRRRCAAKALAKGMDAVHQHAELISSAYADDERYFGPRPDEELEDSTYRMATEIPEKMIELNR
jgi:hypothetical protein